MNLEIPQGSKINIQGIDCFIPPEGYVLNMASKLLEYRGVYERSPIISEQYWERIPLPTWYAETMKRWDAFDKKKKDDDGEFYDERLEEYKKQEWDRRLNGFWFANNGVPTYITGAHYFFLQWIMIDIGYPKFRVPDLEYYYFQQYCIEDANCMGMLEITKRRFGKTFRGGAFLLEYPTRTKMTNAGIQSKTGADAKKVFAKAVINPFIKLPKFFRPEYDMQGGIRPKTDIKFQQTNVRGKKSEDGLDKEELGSMIDHQSADPLAYDGQKLHRYFADEWAKTVECDIYERHEVVRYCLLDDESRIIGKALYSSTVEVLDSEKDGVQDAAIKLWNDSDQLKRNSDGRTASGLYRFFMTADRARNFDIYGIPNVDKTIKSILADRETVKHNPKSLAARIRKEARTIDEAFYAGNDECEFNAVNLANHIKELEANPPYLRQMRLDMVKGIKKAIFPHQKDIETKKVVAMDDAKGGWFFLEQPNELNKFVDRGDYIEPLNTHRYIIGVDTTKDLPTENGSKPRILVFKKSLIVDGEEKGLYPVAMWLEDTRLDIHFDEQVFMACLIFGCKVNYEIDARTDYYRYFCNQNAQALLQWTPKLMQNPVKRGGFKPEPGVRSGDPFQLAQQLQIAKMYIDGTDNENYNGHVHRIKFLSLVKQLLKYKHHDRTAFDECIALFMALVAVFGEIETAHKTLPAVKILPQYKIKCS